LYTTVIMNETLHDRSSVTSDVGDIESSQNENQLDDQRFQFIFNYLNLVYGITPVAFQKGSFFFFYNGCSLFNKHVFFMYVVVFENEFNRKLIDEFFDRTRILICEYTETLNLYNEFPNEFKSKLICFIKRQNKPIDKDISLKKQMTIVEFTQSSIVQFSRFLSDVLWPILQRKEITDNWPDIINRNCLQNLSDLTNLLTVTNGTIRGQTVLPIPHEIEFLGRSDYLRVLNRSD